MKFADYIINHSKNDACSFWSIVLDQKEAIRPYCWDNSITVFEPSLLFLQNKFTEAEWFPRYIDISLLAIDIYGIQLLEKNEDLVLDWLRHYYFLLNSENLLLKEDYRSEDQLQIFEKHIATFLLNSEWKKLAIQDLSKGTSQTCLGRAWMSILQGNDLDLLPFSWLLRKIVSQVDGVDFLLHLARDTYFGKHMKEHLLVSALMILDGTRKTLIVDLKLMEDVMDMLIGIDTLSDRFSQLVIFFLRLVNNPNSLQQLNIPQFERLLNHVRSLIGETKQWGQLSETNIILISQLFLVSLKSHHKSCNESILDWALFFTVSHKSPVLLFYILELTEAICFSKLDENWSNLKENRDELFYQTLSLFVNEAKAGELSGPVKQVLACLSRITRAVPEHILLESSLFNQVNPVSANLSCLKYCTLTTTTFSVRQCPCCIEKWP